MQIIIDAKRYHMGKTMHCTKNKAWFIAGFLLFSLTCSLTIAQDKITFKSGKTVEGEVIRYDHGKLTIRKKNGDTTTGPIETIAVIEFGKAKQKNDSETQKRKSGETISNDEENKKSETPEGSMKPSIEVSLDTPESRKSLEWQILDLELPVGVKVVNLRASVEEGRISVKLNIPKNEVSHTKAKYITVSFCRSIITYLMSKGINPKEEGIVISVWAITAAPPSPTGVSQELWIGRARYLDVKDSLEYIKKPRLVKRE